MAEMALLASVASAAGGIASGYAAKREGAAQSEAMRKSAEFEAARLQEKANEERAAGQRDAHNEREKADLLASRATAVAASSGAGVETPTILNVLEDIGAEGEMKAGQKRFVSESRARGYEDQANAGIWNVDVKGESSKRRGDAAFMGSILEGFGTAASGAYKYKTGNYGKGWG